MKLGKVIIYLFAVAILTCVVGGIVAQKGQPPAPPTVSYVTCTEQVVTTAEIQTWTEYAHSQGCGEVKLQYTRDGYWSLRAVKMIVTD